MRFTRREALLGAAVAAIPLDQATADPLFAPKAGAWRSFQITTRLEILKPDGAVRAWIPLPSFEDAGWVKPISNGWQANTDKTRQYVDPVYGAAMVVAEWEAGAPTPRIDVTARFTTRDRAIDFPKPGQVTPLSAADRMLYTRGTE